MISKISNQILSQETKFNKELTTLKSLNFDLEKNEHFLRPKNVFDWVCNWERRKNAISVEFKTSFIELFHYKHNILYYNSSTEIDYTFFDCLSLYLCTVC